MFRNDVSVAAIVDAISNAAASRFYGTHHFEIKHCPRNLPVYQDDAADQFLRYRKQIAIDLSLKSLL
jgi:hypothetical protein